MPKTKYTLSKEITGGGHVTLYTAAEPNAKGETMQFEVCHCHVDNADKNKKCLPYIWYKEGWTDRIISDYLTVHTYVTDSEGACWGRYNPTVKLADDDKKRRVINFEWHFEDTTENEEKLVNEIMRRFKSAKGKSATEKKLDKIKEYAGKHNMEIYCAVPKGWHTENQSPIYLGCYAISNITFAEHIKDKTKEYKKGLLVL